MSGFVDADKYPHTAYALQYAGAVVSGEQVACKWTRLACQRQLDDLEAWQAGDRDEWRFNYGEAERVCKFIELLPHVKGRWAAKGETIELEPWQQFILTTVFGWQRRDEDARGGWVRRFRTVYTEVARKNAKTTLSSGVGLYCGFAEDEAGAEIYSGATGRDQARIAFDIAKQMVRKSEGMQEEFGITPQAHTVFSLASGSRFEPLSADVKGLDGRNPHVAVIDEYHAHKDSGVYDALETGMGSREQPLMWIITTAGSNLGGPCYRAQDYVKRLLDGVEQDESYFGIIYSIDQPESLDEDDEGDDWTDPAVWVKANPNLGVSVFEDDLERLCKQAKADPVKQSAFLTKRLNVWVSADIAWMNMGEWNACGEPFELGDFLGEPCFMGLDLASKDDVAALAMIFERDGELYYHGKYFLPKRRVQEKSTSTHQKYAGWAAAGKFILTPGNIIDFGMIEDEILELSKTFQVEEIGFDPWQATQLATRLAGQGATTVEVRPTVAHFSEPMKELGAMVKERTFHHGGDPVLAWMVSNVVAHWDKKDNIFPTKERPENKIDGVVAVLMAMSRWLRHRSETSRFDEDPDAELLVV